MQTKRTLRWKFHQSRFRPISIGLLKRLVASAHTEEKRHKVTNDVFCNMRRARKLGKSRQGILREQFSSSPGDRNFAWQSVNFSSFFYPQESSAWGGFINENGITGVHRRPTFIPENWEDDCEYWQWSNGLKQPSLTTPSCTTLRDSDAFCDLPRVDKIQEAISRVDKHLETLKMLPWEDRYVTLMHMASRLQMIYGDSDRPSVIDRESAAWTRAVNVMKEARELKEILLSIRPLPVERLDKLDRTEEAALKVLYGSFRYLLGISSSPTPTLFSKSLVDELVEMQFGSVDFEPEVTLSRRDAQLLFSDYLSRKVWCAIPWRKLGTAIDDFKSRVLVPISAPKDEYASKVACRILELLLLNIKAGELAKWREWEPSPESACLERSRQEGGKRFAILSGSRKITNYVKPVAIYTGGKIRVISEDSADNVQFNWINKILGSQFKRLKCSVFGGDVTEWWEKIGHLSLDEDEYFVSGDLESATDLFDGRITDDMIDLLSKFFYKKSGEAEAKARKMKGFTTQALLKFGKKQFSRQQRGQLMGSVISFPLLCILSLTAYVLTIEHDRLFSPKGFKWLRKLSSVGVNGDDVVFKATKGQMQNWVSAVGRIGGKVSRGKTLVSKTYFTVNSELWSFEGKINCLRPSLLTALTGNNRYFIQPQYEWKEFMNCELVPRRGEKIWNLVSKLNLDLPPSMGGLGLVNSFSQARVSNALKRTYVERAQRPIVLASSRFIIERERIKQELKSLGTRYELFVTKRVRDEVGKIFDSNFMQFRLKPNEIRFCVSELARPDIFDARYLEPFREQFENLYFPDQEDIESINRYVESLERPAMYKVLNKKECEESRQETSVKAYFKGSTYLTKSWSELIYDCQMRGLKRAYLPVGIIRRIPGNEREFLPRTWNDIRLEDEMIRDAAKGGQYRHEKTSS